ncbi:hypothetical protein QP938_02385 [Porticoccaceae bacterium LTM1]|nr:hypothetical protein QP938_02385 [Porticoccaceae bacterium LTM1]
MLRTTAAFVMTLPLLIASGPTIGADNSDASTAQSYIDAIEARQAELGAYDPGLTELYQGLAHQYQEQGHHSEAINALQRAMHINRVEYGPYSILQEPMLREMIPSLTAQGAIDKLAFNYHLLVGIYRKHYGQFDAKLLTVLNEASQWHRSQLRQTTFDITNSHIGQMCELSEEAEKIAKLLPDNNTEERIIPLQLQAECHYYNRLYEEDRWHSRAMSYSAFDDRQKQNQRREELRRHERELYNLYQMGLAKLERVYQITVNDNSSPAHQAQAQIAIADWHLIHDRVQSANDAYRLLWLRLDNNPDLQQELFGRAVLLPNFIADTPPADANRLAHVRLNISERGKPSRIRVLETLPEQDKQTAKEAQRLIRNSLFRPHYKNGRPEELAEVDVTLPIKWKEDN